MRFSHAALRLVVLTVTLVGLLLVPRSAAAQQGQVDPGATRSAARWRWGGFVEKDLGVLLMSGGTGLFTGPSYGPVRVGAGFYRFDSPIKALGGVPDGFELKVDWIISGDVTWFFASDHVEGPYVRALSHVKQQRVTNLSNGVRRDLFSVLAGPEVGWVFRVYRGLYLAPRAGALYYIERPQGPANAPIDVGAKLYDNDRHKTFDLYATLGIGYAF